MQSQLSSDTAAPKPALSSLPIEVILQIIDFLDLPALARFQQCSKGWHGFVADQSDRIYAARDPSTSPCSADPTPEAFTIDGCARRVDRLQHDTHDVSYYGDTISWKELVKKRVLLQRNWRGPYLRDSPTSQGDLSKGTPRLNVLLPHMSETSVPVPVAHRVWRFRPDFSPSARFILTTAKHGGMMVVSMDEPYDLLWKYEAVRAHAHLEYSDVGIAIWDRWGEGLEVWKRRDIFMDENGQPHPPTTSELGDGEGSDASEVPQRGSFYRAAILPHQVQLRGFQLNYPHLCVVSSDGKGFIYDVSRSEAEDMLIQTIDIERGARGHLYQSEDVVVYSYEQRGFHFYDKHTGTHIGTLHPRTLLHPDTLPADNQYHIKHTLPTVSSFPDPLVHLSNDTSWARDLVSIAAKTMADRKTPESTPLRRGPLKPSGTIRMRDARWALDEDEWGAAALWHDWMVGISRGGRVMICADWRGALASAERAKEVTSVIECGNSSLDPLNFDLGGWLSVKHGRVVWEVDDRVFLLHLPLHLDTAEMRPGHLIPADAGPHPRWPQRSIPQPTSLAVYLIPSMSDAQLSTPISYMSLHEDCLMTTWADVRVDDAATEAADANDGLMRLAESKTIRIVSFLPPPEGEWNADEGLLELQDQTLWERRAAPAEDEVSDTTPEVDTMEWTMGPRSRWNNPL